jgi:hypothetical protein
MTSQRPKPWRQLLESGFETRLYAIEDLPTGKRRVLLENSAWHPNQWAVVWFLRDLDSEQLYRITIFKNRQTGGYGPVSDLADVAPGTSLTIEIHQNRTGTFRIQNTQL